MVLLKRKMKKAFARTKIYQQKKAFETFIQPRRNRKLILDKADQSSHSKAAYQNMQDRETLWYKKIHKDVNTRNMLQKRDRNQKHLE